MAKKSGNMLGSWSFLIGVVLALIFGIVQPRGLNPILTYALVVIGISLFMAVFLGLLDFGYKTIIDKFLLK